MVIYLITNKINNKQYVGQTIQGIKARWRQHRSCKTCTYLSRALQKYGSDSFTVEVVETCNTIEDLNSREIHWMAHYRTLAPAGYNLRAGGGSRGKVHAHTRRKISASLQGEKNHFYGKTHSEETRALISSKLSGENSPNWGKIQTAKHNKNISKGNMGRKLSAEHKQKLSRKIQCGDTIYPSMKEAARGEQMSPSSVHISCSTGVSRKGRKFRYAD